MVKKTFNFIVNGGKATGGPPIGPAIGPMGVNIMQIVNVINNKTAEYDGLPVPVELIIETDDKSFEVKVGMLTTFALISQTTGIDKGSGEPNKNFVADLTFKELVNIAKKKQEGIYAASLKAAVSEILGTCQSAGVTVDGVRAKELQKAISDGKYEEQFNELE